MPAKPTYELEFTTSSHRWKDLSLPLKKMAGDCGVRIEVVAVPQGLFRRYNCVVSGQRDSLELFKNRWAENKKPVNLRR